MTITEQQQFKTSIKAWAEQELSSLNLELSTLESEIKRITQVIDGDTESLAAIKVSVKTDDVIKQKAAVNEAGDKVRKLTELLDKQTVIVADNKDTASSAHELKAQRGQLLAEAAVGKDVAKDLTKLDSEIAKLEKADSLVNQTRAAALQQANETIDGLTDMLAGAQRALEQEQHTYSIVYNEFLKHMAKEKAGLYITAAAALQKTMVDIVCIDSLIRDLGIDKNSGAILDRMLVELPRLVGVTQTAIDSRGNASKQDVLALLEKVVLKVRPLIKQGKYR